MYKESFFIGSFLKLIFFCRDCYKNSFLGFIIGITYKFISDVISGSFIFELFSFKKEKNEKESFILNIFSGIYSFFVKIIRIPVGISKNGSKVLSFLNRFKEIFKNSMIGRLGLSGVQNLIFAFMLLLPIISDSNILIFIGLIFIVFTIKMFFNEDINIKTSDLYKYTMFIFIIMIVNTVLSVNPSGSIRDLGIHFMGILMLFVIINEPMNKNQMDKIFEALIYIGTLISIYGIYQYFAGVPMGSGWVDTTQNPDLTVRVFGTFENPNLFAEYLIMIFPIVYGKILYSNKISKKILFGTLSLIMFVALLMTASRAGWLGFVFGLLIFVLVLNFKIIFPMGILGLMAIPFMPDSIIHRIKTIGSLSDSSNYYRYSLWKSTIAIVKDFWQTGIGFGYLSFRSVTPYYIKNMAPYHTHNTYLQVLVEFGVVGFVLFLLFCLKVFTTGVKTFKYAKDKYISIFSIAMVSSFSSVMLHGIAENIFFNPKIIIMFWFIIGFIIKLSLMADIYDEENN